jgi:ABC-type dipeptide/oligopeptide/nickel transport system permease subunit
MSALAISCLIFLLVLGGIFAGTALRRALPNHHLGKETQDVVRLGAGLIATIAALVLGLLIGGAKGSFDVRSTQLKQLTANVILVDSLLAQYAPLNCLRSGVASGPVRPAPRRTTSCVSLLR